MKNTLEKEWKEYVKAHVKAKKLVIKAKEIQQKVMEMLEVKKSDYTPIEVRFLGVQAFGLYMEADKLRNDALLKWLNSIIKKHGKVGVATRFAGETHEYDYLLENGEVYEFEHK